MESSERSRYGEATRGKRGEADKEGKCTPNADVRRVIDPKHAVLRPPPWTWLTSRVVKSRFSPSFLPSSLLSFQTNRNRGKSLNREHCSKRKRISSFDFIDLLNEIRLEVSIDFGTSSEEVEWKGG